MRSINLERETQEQKTGSNEEIFMIKKLSVVLALMTDQNDYQLAMAESATLAAQKLGINLKIVYANNDAIEQTQQVLSFLQAGPSLRPDAIVLEPVGTGMLQAAKLAATSGVGWVMLNRTFDYISDLRAISKAPMFAVSTDNNEVGRIQGRQFAVLAQPGTSVLYIELPTSSDVAQMRTVGMSETKPAGLMIRGLKGAFTDESGYKAVTSWLRLATARESHISLIAAQNDVMAMGARRAFQELQSLQEREAYLSLPFTGCDGLPNTGIKWIHSGALTATIITPPNAGNALEMLAQAVETGVQPPAQTFTRPVSFPALEELTRNQASRSRILQQG